MKVFVLTANSFDDSVNFAVFSTREGAEACKVRIENAIVTFSPDLACVADGRSCISCPGREDCIEWERKWGCTVNIKEFDLDDLNATPPADWAL